MPIFPPREEQVKEERAGLGKELARTHYGKQVVDLAKFKSPR